MDLEDINNGTLFYVIASDKPSDTGSIISNTQDHVEQHLTEAPSEYLRT